MNYLEQQYQWCGRENGKYGDCFRTSIACILNCDSGEEIPNYMENVNSDEDWKNAYSELEVWLYKNKKKSIMCFMLEDDLEGTLDWINFTCKNIPVIIGIPTLKHAVIALNGEIIHDPLTPENRSPLLNETQHYSLFIVTDAC